MSSKRRSLPRKKPGRSAHDDIDDELPVLEPVADDLPELPLLEADDDEDDGPIVEALNTQALAEIRMGDWDAAYAAGARAMDLRDASGLEPSALNHLFLSQALRGRGQREAADEAFERAAMLRADDLSPPDPVAEALFEEAMEGSTGR